MILLKGEIMKTITINFTVKSVLLAAGVFILGKKFIQSNPISINVETKVEPTTENADA